LDSYLNREISHFERIKMATRAYFFLHLWRFHIETIAHLYPDHVSLAHNFLAPQSFNIFTSLAESLLLLIKIHREFYSTYPLLPWKHGTEACEHFFGIARQLHNDFKYNDILNLVPKITHYTKSIKAGNIALNKEKTVREGMFFYIFIFKYFSLIFIKLLIL
jgi:hypothetical protein